MEALQAHQGQHRREAAAQRDGARPNFNVKFYVVNRHRARYAGVGPVQRRAEGQADRQFAVCTENGPQTLPCEALLGEGPAA